MVTYNNHDIVFQEIPNEVSIAFTIEGCPNNCVGCHSPHLREQNGDELTIALIESILKQYDVTCILFLGGDAFHTELYLIAKHFQSLGYRMAIYSGNDTLDERLLDVFMYYKIGSYQSELGGLDSINTNQRLYKYTTKLENITREFWNENSKMG